MLISPVKKKKFQLLLVNLLPNHHAMDNEQSSPGKGTINISEANDVAYWVEKLDITKVRLKAAVNAVGPAVKDVEVYLKKK